jgi:hypothetical protein
MDTWFYFKLEKEDIGVVTNVFTNENDKAQANFYTVNNASKSKDWHSDMKFQATDEDCDLTEDCQEMGYE